MPVKTLPIWEIHAAILGVLAQHNRLVLVAPTGSGKTTQVPQMLLDQVQSPKSEVQSSDAPLNRQSAIGNQQFGKIVVLQPRRVAARTVAARVAWERDGRLGDEVGYQIRFEDHTSLGTRICFVTEGILLRWLQDDRELSDVSAVLFDEFHERNLLSDVALALVKQLQETRRPDLKIVVMSATLDAEPVAEYLATTQPDRTTVPCPILISEGQSFPVVVRYLDYGDHRPITEQAADAVERIVNSGEPGDILVFMPGMGEINSVLGALRSVSTHEHLAGIPLHGELPPEDQDLAFAPNEHRKVVVSTNVAETSVTIDGIRHVVDGGVARVARYDAERGIGTLFLEEISRASADQRKGRAGRTAPGTCHRLWTESSHLNRPERNTPEIQRSDLAEIVLLLHSLGIKEAAKFDWLDKPDPQAVERAEQLLRLLGALREPTKETKFQLADEVEDIALVSADVGSGLWPDGSEPGRVTDSTLQQENKSLRPSEKLLTLTESYDLSPESNELNSVSNELTHVSNQITSESNQPTSESNQLSSRSNHLPYRSNDISSESNELPSGSNHLPIDNKQRFDRKSRHSEASNDLTPAGRQMLRLPMHPRYSRMLVEAAKRGCVPAAALCAALVSGRDLLARLSRDDSHIKEARELFEASQDSDFYMLMRAYQFAKQNSFNLERCRRYGINAQVAKQVEQVYEQLLEVAQRERLMERPERQAGGRAEAAGTQNLKSEISNFKPETSNPKLEISNFKSSISNPKSEISNIKSQISKGQSPEDALLRCLMAGFIDQLAVRRDQGTLACELTEGRQGTLMRESVVHNAPLFVTASIREVPSRTSENLTLLGLATAIKREWIAELFPQHLNTRVDHLFDRTHKRVAAVALTRFRDLVIHHEHQSDVEPLASGRCLAEAFAKDYFELPQLGHELKQFIARVNLVCAAMPELEFPPFDDAALVQSLARAFAGLTLVKEAQAAELKPAFAAHLAPEQRGWLDELTPVQIPWLEGKKLKLTYVENANLSKGEALAPEAQVKLTECFPLVVHPRICEGVLPVKLWLCTPDGKRAASTCDWRRFKVEEYPKLRPTLVKKYPGFTWG